MLDKRKFYINGEWVNTYKENDCEVINPCNEEPFATISLGSKEDTDLAVKSAKTAFESWKETTKEERINYLEKLLYQFIKKDLEKWQRLFHWKWERLWIGQLMCRQHRVKLT